jgi:hypothetical protein
MEEVLTENVALSLTYVWSVENGRMFYTIIFFSGVTIAWHFASVYS